MDLNWIGKNYLDGQASVFDLVRNEEKIKLLGAEVIFVRYGHCHTHRAFFIKDRVIYMFDKQNDGVQRREFFFGKQLLLRIYQGNQFCFLEYVGIAHSKGRLPSKKDLANMGQSKETMALYRATLERLVE